MHVLTIGMAYCQCVDFQNYDSVFLMSNEA